MAKKRKTRNIKRRKHDKIVTDYDEQKRKHLERLVDKMLKDEDEKDKWREKDINTDFFDNF